MRRVTLTAIATIALAATVLGQEKKIAIRDGDFEATRLANPAEGAGDNFIICAGDNAPIKPAAAWTFVGSAPPKSNAFYAGISDLGVHNHGPEGRRENNILWLYIPENRPKASLSVTQQLTAAVQPKTKYTLKVKVAQSAHAEGKANMPNPDFPKLGDGVSTGDVFARLRVGTVATEMPGYVSSEVSEPPDNEWVTWTIVWQTAATEPLAGKKLVLEFFSTAEKHPRPVEVFFDDVELTTAPAE